MVEVTSEEQLSLLSHLSCVRLCATPQTQPTRLCRPWDSLGKNTGVGCHFFLQCMKVKSESEVAQSCPTLCDPMDCSLPGSSVHVIFQARVLEWGAIAFSDASNLTTFRMKYMYPLHCDIFISLCYANSLQSDPPGTPLLKHIPD